LKANSTGRLDGRREDEIFVHEPGREGNLAKLPEVTGVIWPIPRSAFSFP
jgi:hypothetical protein